MSNKIEPGEMQAQINQAIEIIQDALVANSLKLFPCICAMLSIVHSYKLQSREHQEIISGFERVLAKAFVQKDPDSTIMH